MVNNLNSISKFGGMPRVDRADALRTDADVAYWPFASICCVAAIRPVSGVKPTWQEHCSTGVI